MLEEVVPVMEQLKTELVEEVAPFQEEVDDRVINARRYVSSISWDGFI